MMWATILILSVLQEKVETRDLYLLHGDFCGIILSIHDLTRRSTAGTEHYCDRRDPFNSRPHTEVDAGMFGLLMRTSVTFNSRPHTEVDSQEWEQRLSACPFNSRPHTEVDPSVRLVFEA